MGPASRGGSACGGFHCQQAAEKYLKVFRYPGAPYEPETGEAAAGRALAEQVRAAITRAAAGRCCQVKIGRPSGKGLSRQFPYDPRAAVRQFDHRHACDGDGRAVCKPTVVAGPAAIVRGNQTRGSCTKPLTRAGQVVQ